MKKASAAALLSLALVFLLCACGKANSPAVIEISPGVPENTGEMIKSDSGKTSPPAGIDFPALDSPEDQTEPITRPSVLPSAEGVPAKPGGALPDSAGQIAGQLGRQSDVLSALPELLARGCRFYDIVYGKGLAVDINAESKEEYWTYYPVIGEEGITSVSQLREEGLAVFTREECEIALFDDAFGCFYSRYMEDEDGTLYASPYSGGDLRDILWDTSNAQILLETGDKVYITMSCRYGDAPENILPGCVIVKKTSDGWRLESDVSSSCMPEEKRRANEISVSDATAQFYQMSSEETGLARASEEYTLVFEREIVEISGVRCYNALLFADDGEKIAKAGDILIALDGSGLVSRRPDERMSADYSYRVYRGYGDGCLAALEYLGGRGDTELGAIAAEFAETCLLSGPETVDCLGEDVYALIPKYVGTRISVFPVYETGAIGEEMYSSDSGTLVIACNVSDIWPNALVRIEYLDKTVEFSPFLSGEDGSVVAVPGVRIIENGE